MTSRFVLECLSDDGTTPVRALMFDLASARDTESQYVKAGLSPTKRDMEELRGDQWVKVGEWTTSDNDEEAVL